MYICVIVSTVDVNDCIFCVNEKEKVYYPRYVDGTLTIMLNITAATDFLNTLNEAHPFVSFTMEIEIDGMLPSLGTQLLNRAPQIETKVYLCLFSLINYTNNPKMLPCLSYVYWAKYNQSTNGVNGYGQNPIAAFF